MKSVKKTAILVAAVLSISFAHAQVGIQAGYANSKAVDADRSLNGFYVGPSYKMSIQGPISLQYALFYNYLTASTETIYGGLSTTSTTTAHRLDLPVRLNIDLPLMIGVKAFVFGGPDFNYAISQTTKGTANWGPASGTVNGENIYSLEDGNGKKIYNPFDVQLGIGAGIQFNKMSLRVSYDWGLIDRDNTDNGVWKNNDLKIGIGYEL